jgi:uncharacterized protein
MNFTYSISGFVVGFIVGLTGVGGGSLMTPLLVLFFGIKPVVAVGTDLLYASLTKCGGIWVHHHKGTIKWSVVRRLAMGSLPASVLTLVVLHYFDMRGIGYERLVTSALGVALILTSLVLLLKNSLSKVARDTRFSRLRTLRKVWRAPLTVVVGVILGTLVTLTSVGAGALGVAALFFLYPNIPAISIVGSDLAHAVPLTAVAGLGHLQLGTVDLKLLGSLLVGSLPGIYLGSHVGFRLPERAVRTSLATMLMIIGLKFAL